ncbi:ribonuclease E inhibitor RraB [Glaciecola sp. 1036]|uniref:ribonuclease E inhibitor RraB n=1 Tax=Alteromonadaceae TaxID=72275 RepID=UPI003D08D077
MSDELQDWFAFNEETINALIEDGTDSNKPHQIEHHFASQDFDRLEKAAVDVFKLGFEVGDAEELVLDDGGVLFCFDAVVEKKLDVATFNTDTEKLVAVASKHKVHYDGWGTYFIEKLDA